MREKLSNKQKRDMAQNDWPAWLAYLEKKYPRHMTIRFVSAEEMEREQARHRIGLGGVIWMGKDIE